MFEKYNNIVAIVGAGISVNAGIPDFRSINGLYSKDNKFKKKYNLSDNESIEDIMTLEYFMTGIHLDDNYEQVKGFGPDVINDFIKDIKNKKLEPTFTHIFLSNLVKYGKIRRIYTQNIDCLEEKAGIPKDKIVYCHGNYKTASCCKCNKKYDINTILNNFDLKEYTYCDCGGIIKPDIILFGEKLKDEFFDKVNEDLDTNKCDLMLIIGTSLSVSPVNRMLRTDIPIIYVSKERPSYEIIDEYRKLTYYVKDCDEFFRNNC